MLHNSDMCHISLMSVSRNTSISTVNTNNLLSLSEQTLFHVPLVMLRGEHGKNTYQYSNKICPCYFQLFQSKDAPNKTTTPEEFIRMTKGITMATAKAVAAGNSARQEDIIHTANLSRKAISDMLSTCKVLLHTILCLNVIIIQDIVC